MATNEGGQLRGARKKAAKADFHARAATAARVHLSKQKRDAWGRLVCPKCAARGHRRGKPNSAFIADRKAARLAREEAA